MSIYVVKSEKNIFLRFKLSKQLTKSFKELAITFVIIKTVRKQISLKYHDLCCPPSIVINIKFEKVILLKSDNLYSWVKGNGYPNEEDVIKSITNPLEDGVESFNHKAFIYRKILDN